jgi:uncharacterized cupin superfamily protein
MITTVDALVSGTTVTAKIGEVDSDEWEPYFVDGVATGRLHVLEVSDRPDGPVTSGIWQHRVEDSPGGSFRFTETYEEVFFVIDGEAELTFTDGTVVMLRAGNTFVFPKGAEVVWRTTKDFVKFFVIH